MSQISAGGAKSHAATIIGCRAVFDWSGRPFAHRPTYFADWLLSRPMIREGKLHLPGTGRTPIAAEDQGV
jgi:hypothetical protein